MATRKKPEGNPERWRQQYIDSYNKLMGHPPGLPYLHHNIEAMEKAAKAAREDAKRRAAAPEPKKTVLRSAGSSRPGGSVARARAIFEEMKDESRDAIMAACEKAGINKGTAATQYSRWKRGQ